MGRRSVFRVVQAVAAFFLIIAASANAMAAGYFTQGGKIFDAGGQEIQVRGISHFGFNATILQPQFLWAMGWKEQIAQIKSLGFNAIRVPFVPDTLYNTTPVNQLSYIDAGRNPELIGKTPLQVLDLWMAEADRQGMYILLDFHSVSKQRQYPTWFVSNPADFNLIYNNQAYTKENWLRDLVFVAQRYANLPHFFGIDIYNEPNGIVRWSTGDGNVTNPIYFWKGAAESAATAVLAANPNLLIFVQGINGNFDGIENSNISMNWGEDFQPQAYQPLNIPNDKLVLTPHTYGPDVYVKSSFSATTFPANLAANWDILFGQFFQTHPVVVGEWGGKYGQGTGGQQDITWQNAFVDYLLSKGVRNSFYWCYTPNSGDTGGILDDNLNVRQDKLALLQKLWGGATPSVTSPPPPPPTVTPQPAPVPVTSTSAGTLAVFDDAVTSAWALSGWSSTSTIQTQFVNSGVSAVKVDATTWGGISLDSRDANWNWVSQPANLYTHLSFDVSAGSVVGAAIGSLEASLDLGWGLSAKISDYVKSFAPGVWYHVEIPLSVMNPKGVAFRRIIFQNNGTSSLTFYIDNVKLVNRTTSTTSTGSSTTTTTGTTAYQQQGIMSFSPSSGPVGTVVTLNGSGFTGSNLAWVGNAHNGTVTVISDTQARVTVPAGATTGAIGIFNPSYVAFTASSFTVTTGTTAYQQQGIMSFSPSSGPVGTVVTLNGSGFTGSNLAWVGNAHNGTVTVISDTQARVTVPAGATTGAIGIFNPSYVAFTASSFTVQ